MDDIEIVPNNFTNIGRFSDRQVLLTEDSSFQTNSMIQKIKKVKKKKMANYKNIELLEDIHDAVPEGFQYQQEPIREGLVQYSPHYEDYTGYDDVKDIGNTIIQDPRQLLIDMINIFYDTIDNVKEIVAYETTKLLSGNQFDEGDVPVVKEYISWFLTIFVSIYVSFNWYFILFYTNRAGGKETEQQIKTDPDSLPDSAIFFKIISAPIRYSLKILDAFDSVITHTTFALIKNFINYQFVKTFLFVVTFYATIYVVYNFSDSVRSAAIAVIQFDMKQWYIILLIIV
jgi:hypothetical protein